MKALFFFAGTLFRWSVQEPKQFLFFHAYIIFVYGVTYFTNLVGLNASNLIFTGGMIAPIGFLISQGLPLDCLDYKSAIERELTT
tara:strand:+ start:620 stop:874 length:255 start_codon:yes stop_codon:yes gene_type:complete